TAERGYLFLQDPCCGGRVIRSSGIHSIGVRAALAPHIWFRIRGTVLWVALCAGWSSVAAAAVYYVDGSSGTCSRSRPGTPAQPYCTITAAMNAHTGPGVTILVEPGTYREQVTVPSSGTSSSPFVLKAVNSDVIIDGADS